MTVAVPAAVLVAYAVIEPVSLVGIVLPLAIVRYQSSVSTKENVEHVRPLAEIRAVRGVADAESVVSAHVIGTVAREEAGFNSADSSGCIRAGVAPVPLACGREFHVLGGVVERRIKHDVHSRRVRRANEFLKLLHSLRSAHRRVVRSGSGTGYKCLCQQRHYLEEIPDRVRAPEFIRLIGGGVGLP